MPDPITPSLEALIEQVHRAIGRASMCWKTIPHGEYDDHAAKKIADELVNVICARELTIRAHVEPPHEKSEAIPGIPYH